MALLAVVDSRVFCRLLPRHVERVERFVSLLFSVDQTDQVMRDISLITYVYAELVLTMTSAAVSIASCLIVSTWVRVCFISIDRKCLKRERSRGCSYLFTCDLHVVIPRLDPLVREVFPATQVCRLRRELVVARLFGS